MQFAQFVGRDEAGVGQWPRVWGRCGRWVGQRGEIGELRRDKDACNKPIVILRRNQLQLLAAHQIADVGGIRKDGRKPQIDLKPIRSQANKAIGQLRAFGRDINLARMPIYARLFQFQARTLGQCAHFGGGIYNGLAAQVHDASAGFGGCEFVHGVLERHARNRFALIIVKQSHVELRRNDLTR